MTGLHVHELAEIRMSVLRDLPVVHAAALRYRLAVQEIRRGPRLPFTEELEYRDAGSAQWPMKYFPHPAPRLVQEFPKVQI
ncbi:hypothetical protein [Paraburkholderia sp. EB58]|uniref:hypothetical protein n=1 Tax=Paraburkholderia sp. EB58 TaxID=3035125 RepID=UPI003D1E9E90